MPKMNQELALSLLQLLSAGKHELHHGAATALAMLIGVQGGPVFASCTHVSTTHLKQATQTQRCNAPCMIKCKWLHVGWCCPTSTIISLICTASLLAWNSTIRCHSVATGDDVPHVLVCVSCLQAVHELYQAADGLVVIPTHKLLAGGCDHHSGACRLQGC